jgi:hypothetical protein
LRLSTIDPVLEFITSEFPAASYRRAHPEGDGGYAELCVGASFCAVKSEEDHTGPETDRINPYFVILPGHRTRLPARPITLEALPLQPILASEKD